MSATYDFRAPRLGLSLVLGSLLLSACGDGTTTAPEPVDHAENVEDVQLVSSARTIATYDGPSGTWSDSFEIDAGELSGHIDVRFVDGSGNAVQLGDDFYLEIVSEDPSIVSYFQDDPGGFAFHVEGIAAGEAGLVFRLMHGAIGTGHPDFITEPFEVHVRGPEPEGVQLVLDGETIATYDGDREEWSDSFEIDEGGTSGDIDVRFVDDDGDAIAFGDDYYLEVESEDPSIATFIQDDRGGFAIQIRGVAAGETGLVFRLMHGAVGSGHADFSTDPFEVDVHGLASGGEVEGVRLVSDGMTVATYDHDTEEWSDSFDIGEGETSGHIDVRFVNHDGDALEFGDDYYLEVESQNDSIATFTQDDPGGFAIQIRGVAAGETGLVFRLMHGTVGSGHADFTTEPFEVHVRGPSVAAGVRLMQGRNTIASYDADTRAWSDTLQVRMGTGPHTDVHFLDHDGDVLELGDDYYLEIESQDERIADPFQDRPGDFAIHFRGVAEGETGVVFHLMHGAIGSGHADFSTEPLRVRVPGS